MQSSTRQNSLATIITDVEGTVGFLRLRAGEQMFWWALKDLNLRPKDYESSALTAELRARIAATHSPPPNKQDLRFEKILRA
jgi:hypothetical protein